MVRRRGRWRSAATRHWLPALLIVSVGLFIAAWGWAVPPAEGPDEGAHYIKALGTADGQLLGHAPKYPAWLQREIEGLTKSPEAEKPGERVTGLAALGWALKQSRDFDVPRRLVPDFTCFNPIKRRHSQFPISCGPKKVAPGRDTDLVRVGSYEGTFPPFFYVPPGLLMRAGKDARAAYRLGRVASALIALALLTLAAAALWDARAGALSLSGLMVALTPTVMFVSAMINPNGAEIAAGVCFAASLLRLSRAGEAPRWVWLACMTGGVVLALTRPLGIVFVGFILLAAASLPGPRAFWSALRAGGRWAALTATAIGVAALVGVVWELRYMPRPGLVVADLRHEFGPSLAAVPRILRQAMAFLAEDFYLPASGYVLWAVAFTVLVGAAVVVANRSQRLSLLGVSFLTLVLVVVLGDLYRQSGAEQFYGRYSLPYLVVVPLLAGEVLVTRRERLPRLARRGLVPLLAVVAGCAQLLAWWLTSRRIAVGTDGSFFFASDAGWQPPGGWTLWSACVVAGAAGYVGVGLAGGLTGRPRGGRGVPPAR